MHLLVLNCGSSSIKFACFCAAPLVCLLRGQLEAIGSDNARLILEESSHSCPARDYRQALNHISQALRREGLPAPDAVGHRVVHGGDRFKAPVVIDETVIAAIEATIPLAPLHNPANLAGIDLARKLWPGAVQVAVFDTAFHQSTPPQAFRYAVPQAWYED